LLGVLAAVFLWRILFSAWVNLIPDECSYWVWSRRLDWSYFDNSGMTAYLIRLSTEAFGEHTPFTVRFPFLVLSGLTTLLVYKTSVILFGSKSRGLFAAVLFNLTPAALLGGSAAMHDNALMFFWVAALWAAARLVRSGDPRWCCVVGLAAGLCIQSKYTGVLVLPCMLLFLMWSTPHRKLLLTKEPWIGALIAIVCTLPIVWWNYRHEWASLHHILFIGSGSPSVFRRLSDGAGYHLAQFGLLSPLFYVALSIATVTALVRNLRNPKPEQLLLLCFGFPLLLFGIMAFKGHVEANWAFMGYVSTGILAVEIIFASRHGTGGGIGRRFGPRYRTWAVALSIVPVTIAVLHAWIGLLPASIEKKLGKADRIIWETRGWGDLGVHVKNLESAGDVLAADSYQLCALLEFNVPENPYVRYLAPWKRPTVFDVWEPSFDNLAGRTVLYVSPKPLNPSSDVLTTVYENFKRVEPLPSFHVMYHGESIREIYVYRCSGFNPWEPRRLGPRSLLYKDY
ncbi:MAG: glycosyltransferase family 39 protein, partial [Desulfomonilaceae bacterium]|nr:glycosyltransferase family 39 protein [Desulfomonilaceae bacterium]